MLAGYCRLVRPACVFLNHRKDVLARVIKGCSDNIPQRAAYPFFPDDQCNTDENLKQTVQDPIRSVTYAAAYNKHHSRQAQGRPFEFPGKNTDGGKTQCYGN